MLPASVLFEIVGRSQNGDGLNFGIGFGIASDNSKRPRILQDVGGSRSEESNNNQLQQQQSETIRIVLRVCNTYRISMKRINGGQKRLTNFMMDVWGLFVELDVCWNEEEDCLAFVGSCLLFLYCILSANAIGKRIFL